MTDTTIKTVHGDYLRNAVLPSLKFLFAGIRAHWKRYGSGGAVMDMHAHIEAKWLAIDAKEWDSETGHTKRVMLTLEEKQVRELRDYCNKILGD